jgi:hypothetical protein
MGISREIFFDFIFAVSKNHSKKIIEKTKNIFFEKFSSSVSL